MAVSASGMHSKTSAPEPTGNDGTKAAGREPAPVFIPHPSQVHEAYNGEWLSTTERAWKGKGGHGFVQAFAGFVDISLFPDGTTYSGYLTPEQAKDLAALLVEAAEAAQRASAGAKACGTCGFAKVHRRAEFDSATRKWRHVGPPSCRGNGCPEA